MPLGLATRELELIIIATDRTQATLARVGGGLTLLGVGMTRLAWEGVEAFASMTEEAMDFDRQARLAFTQVDDKATTTLEDVKDVLRNVASQVGRPIEELQEGIFDIFSSIDANAETAEFALKKVAQAAVAGQTDVRSALIPTIATLNAFNEPLENIDNVLDIQFKTVQKGIITYDELTAGIGKVIPAAVAAGQSQEQMGAIIAFLTRNGLSAQMAMTSAARAMELFADPKSQKNLKKAGIAVKDETGEFRQMNEVLTDLQVIFGDLTAPERKEKFKELFGTGRIQARRFFDVAIPQFNELNDLVNEFSTSSGAMQDAYDIMFDTPLSKIDVLRNRFELLRIEVGEFFIPLIESEVIPVVEDLFDRWDALSDEQKNQIVQYAAMGTAALGALGILTSLLGVSILFGAVWKTVFKVIGIAVLHLSKVSLILAAVAGAAWWVYKNWDRVGPALADVWEKAKDALQSFWGWLVGLWEGKIRPLLQKMWEDVKPLWQRLVSGAKELWPLVVDTVKSAVSFIKELVESLLDVIIWLWDHGGKQLVAVVGWVWDFIKGFIGDALRTIGGILDFFTALLQGRWSDAWDHFIQVLKDGWLVFLSVFKIGFLKNIFAALPKLFKNIGPVLAGVANTIGFVWSKIASVITAFWPKLTAGAGKFGQIFQKVFIAIWTVLSKLVQGVIWLLEAPARFKGFWSKYVLEPIADIFAVVSTKSRWVADHLMEIFRILGDVLGTPLRAVRFFFVAIAGIVVGIMKIGRDIANFFLGIFPPIRDAIMPVIDWIVGAWEKVLGIFKSGGGGFFDKIKQAFVSIKGAVVEAFTNVVSFFKNFGSNVKNYVVSLFTWVRDFIDKIWNSDIVQTFINVLGIIYEIVRIAFQWILRNIIDTGIQIWTNLVNTWNTIRDALTTTWSVIKAVAGVIWMGLSAFFGWIAEQFRTYLVPVWEIIKTSIIATWHVIEATARWIWNEIVLRIVEAVQPVIDWLQEKWDWLYPYLKQIWEWIVGAAKSLWGEFELSILDPIKRAWNGLMEFIDKVKGWFSNFWETAKEWTGKIRDALKRINPLERGSPSIVEQVDGGMEALGNVLASRLSGIASDSWMRVGEIRSSFADMVPEGREYLTKLETMRNDFMSVLNEIRGAASDPLTLFGFESGTTPDEILRAKAIMETPNPKVPYGSEQYTSPNTVVTIGTINSNADPAEIAKEIAWKVVTS